MRIVVVLLAGQVLVASAAHAQFRVYPREGATSGRLDDTEKRAVADFLATGDFAFDFEGGYDVSMNIVQLYVTPDIDGWDWYLPFLLTTTPSDNPDSREVNALAGSMTGEAEGALNLSVSWAREFRGMKTVIVEGESRPVKSLTGLWLDVGAQGKGHLTTAVTDSTNNTSMSTTVGGFFAAQGQITLSRRTSIQDMDDLAGVLYGRVYGTYAAWASTAGTVKDLTGGRVPSAFFAVEATIGYFLFNGGSVEGSISRAWGVDIDQLEEAVYELGLRFVPRRVLGL